jgi:hypothetical protein
MYKFVKVLPCGIIGEHIMEFWLMFGRATLFSVREKENNTKGVEWREGSGLSVLFYSLFTALPSH